MLRQLKMPIKFFDSNICLDILCRVTKKNHELINFICQNRLSVFKKN